MSTENTLDQLVLANIANVFNAQLSNFTFYTALPNLPATEEDWAQFLDILPSSQLFYTTPDFINTFSQVYGQILNAQVARPLAIQIGDNQYQTANNWLVPFSIPKYTPTLSSAKTAMQQAGQAKITVKSQQQKIVVPTYPAFPELVVSNPLLDFYRAVAQSNFTTTVTFTQAASLPIKVGPWYNSGAFLYAYQTPNNWNPLVISWDQVFNATTGILRDINISIAIVSDMTIVLHVSGNYTQATIACLEQIPQQVIFPFYQQIDSASIAYALEADNSVSITLQVPKSSNYYVFGIQYQNVQSLLS